VLGTTSAAFGTIVMTDEADFVNAMMPGYYLEEFDGFTYGSYTELTLDLAQGGWAYTISAEDQGGGGGLYSGDGNMSNNNAADALRVDFTGDPVTAIGGFFFPGEINGFFQAGPMRIELSDGTVYEYDSVSDTDFLGFVSEAPITWMLIDAVGLDLPDWPTMDHFYVGTAVPAPSVVALLGLAGFARRRRR